MLGLQVKQVIVTVPSTKAIFSVVGGSIEVKNEGNLITGDDVAHVIHESIKGNVPKDYEFISMMPTAFYLDDDRVIRDPKGLTSKTLKVRGVISLTPKTNIYPVLACLERIGVEVLDITLGAIGDYYEVKNKDLDSKVGAIINLGAETTTVSIFNKGIITNNKVLNYGGLNIDNDISYMYKLPIEKSKKIKEQNGLRLSNHPTIEIENDDKKITIDAKELKSVIESRTDEIIKLALQEIKDLTKKEISYIIFTGGLTELLDLKDLLDRRYPGSKIMKNEEIGARNNKFSASLGIIKYHAYNAKMRDKDFSIFTIEEQQQISGTVSETETDSAIGKLFGYIFNN
jgi:cell division protein FtsA